MNNTALCICFVILFSFLPLQADSQASQQTIDSLEAKSSRIEKDSAYVRTLMSYIWDHARTDRTVSFHFLDKVENFADSLGMKYKRDKMIYYRGVLLKNEKAFAQSEAYFKEFQQLKIEKKDTQWMAACHNVLLNLYVDMEEYERASVEANKAITMYERTKDTVGMVRVGSRIGYLLSKFGNVDSGLKYIEKAYRLGRGMKDRNTYSYVINDMGYGYEKKGELDSARYYYQEFSNYSALHGLHFNAAFSSFNLATIAKKKGETEKALVLSKKAIELADKYEDKGMQNAARFLTGQLLGKLDRYEEAFRYMKGVNEETMELADMVAKNEIYYKFYKKKGNYARALAYHEEYKNYTDSVKSVSITETINEIETKYETAKKDQEIETLALKDEFNQSQISWRNRWIGVLALGLGGLGLLLLRIFKQNRLITTQKDKLSVALNDKNVLLKEIHHRVKNNLQVISSLLGLQSRYVKDDVAQDALKVSKSRVQSMALLHQKLYGNKDLKSVNVKQYYEELIGNLVSIYQINGSKIKFEIDVDDINLDIDTIVPIGLITNELISNALKHAFTEQESGTVTISLKEQGSSYRLRVSDDGKGLPFTELPEQSKSLGVQLVKSFAEKLEGTIKVSTDNGATFEILIPKE